jgi:HAD superfamily hydrolase (TIGR01509 family)
MIELVIFDCDGVLVDSEPITNQIFMEMLRDLGLDFTLAEMHERFVGRSMKQCMTIVEELRGSALPEAFLDEYHRRTHDALGARVEAMPGARDTIEKLVARGIAMCVASSGEHDKMRVTLGRTKLLPFFEGRMFSATEVARGKPFPDVFLYAAERMGFSPARAMVIEDSEPGVRAAVAAGMPAIGFTHATPAERLERAGAARTIARLDKVAGLLGEFANSKHPAD